MLGILRSYSNVNISWWVQLAIKCFWELIAGIHVSGHAKELYPGCKYPGAAAIAKSQKKIKSILARHLLFCTKISLFWALERYDGMRLKALVLGYQKKWFILKLCWWLQQLGQFKRDRSVFPHGTFHTKSWIVSQPLTPRPHNLNLACNGAFRSF